MIGRASGSFEAARMRVLHRVAQAALRLQSPLNAKSTVDRVGRRLPPFADGPQASAAMVGLLRCGTCLSRALAVAARLPGAEVVIGVDPWSALRPSAHAWIEHEGACIDARAQGMNEARPLHNAWTEIARLPPTRR